MRSARAMQIEEDTVAELQAEVERREEEIMSDGCELADVAMEALADDRFDPEDITRLLLHAAYPDKLAVDFTLAREKGYANTESQLQYSLDRVRDAIKAAAAERAEHGARSPF